MKKAMLGILIFAIIMSASPLGSFAQTIGFEDLSKHHWVYEMAHFLKDKNIIAHSNRFELGSMVSEKDLFSALSKMNDALVMGLVLPMPSSSEPIKRGAAIQYLVAAFESNDLAQYVSGRHVYFEDAKTLSGEMELALAFGWISKNPQKTFRPNDALKKEEMVAILYRIYQTHQEPFESFHSYYAIQSFQQAHLSKDLSDISHGWSRIEKDPSGAIVLNTSSKNNNEYHVPRGYLDAISATDHEGIKRHLMIFVKDENIYLEKEKKTLSLTEYIIASEENRKATVDAIVSGLLSFKPGVVFDGILIDFEGLRGSENAERFNAFLRQLKASADKHGLEILTAVHPARMNNQAYFDGYDFKTIGNLSSKVILMAHDYYPRRLTAFEMQSGLTITPLAPFNEIYDAISLVIDPVNGVQDPKKVLLQFSMDSVQWKLSEGKISNAIPIRPSYGFIDQQIKAGAISFYSQRLHSPSLVYEDKNDLTRNVIWYENAKSLGVKARLAKSMGIGGLSVWRLGTVPLLEGDLNLWEALLPYY